MLKALDGITVNPKAVGASSQTLFPYKGTSFSERSQDVTHDPTVGCLDQQKSPTLPLLCHSHKKKNKTLKECVFFCSQF